VKATVEMAGHSEQSEESSFYWQPKQERLLASLGTTLLGIFITASPQINLGGLLRGAIEVFHAQRFQFGAQAIHVQSEFSGLQLFAVASFLGQALFA